MAAGMASATILAIHMKKCSHTNKETRVMQTFLNTKQLYEIFSDLHDGYTAKNLSCNIICRSQTTGESFKVEGGMSVGDLSNFGIKYVDFECIEDPVDVCVETAAKAADRCAVNAFQVLMAGGRDYPPKKIESNEKMKLFNDVLQLHIDCQLDFPKCDSKTTGDYMIQVLTNALWYITNDHSTLMDAARKSNVQPVPDVFRAAQFQSKNDFQKKKEKKKPLTANQLESHAQALYSIALKPVMRSTESWKKHHQNIVQLGDCLQSYSKYLKEKCVEVKKNHGLDHPVRQISDHTTAEFCPTAGPAGVHPKYSMLDAAMSQVDKHLFFNEELHLSEPFSNYMQRHRFFQDLRLSMPVDIFRFSPGGSALTTVCLLRVDAVRSVPQMLTEGARFMALPDIRKEFKEYHTRSMKRQFKHRLNNIASVQPAVADFLYRELALDASVARNPTMMERMKLIFLGNEGLLQDLRTLNGSEGGTYEPFFEELKKVVEEATVADERRHNEAHLATWLSVRDLIERTKERCPPNTRIPSKSLVRLQFSPKNPYSKTALSFTSNLQVQYKVQRRQLRATHLDQHYAAAQFKYLRQLAVELGNDKAILIFADDKAKIPIGEPGHTVSTGVRGKKTLTPCSTELVALDHDMNLSSLTPSVVLKCNIPEELDHSFVQGHVTVTVNDSVFNSSSPWRHVAMFAKLLREKQQKILLLFTDGGTDHRHTLESVRMSLICLFVEMNLDMLVAGRCAPGQSFTNPAERVMSILNLGLQNCSLERSSMDDEKEATVRRCGAMKSLRDHPEVKEDWSESIQEPIRTISNRFRRLSLKDQPIEVLDSLPDDEIDLIKRHARERFPDLDLAKVTKATTSKSQSYLAWKEKHCLERLYTFQVRKCNDSTCCLPKLDDNTYTWLPDPVLDETGNHYKKYQEVKGTETQDNSPSLKTKQKKETTKRKALAAPELPQDDPDPSDNPDAFNMSTQTARTIVTCVECRKPRVVYSKQKMSTERQKVAMALAISEYDYSCGAPLLPPEHKMSNKLIIRTNISCRSTVELQYYAALLGPVDICSFCAGGGADPKTELKKKFKTVLPICVECERGGLKPIVARPFGKN